MAFSTWAKVYYLDEFAGILEQRPGGDYLFTYDESFQVKKISIAAQLPVKTKEHLSKDQLHPFFDNLIAEGPLAKIQAKSIGAKTSERFKLLMAFGADLIGAVTIHDPDPGYQIKINQQDYLQELSLRSRASISGVQPKLFAVKKRGKFYPADYQEASTHIAKLPGEFPLIIENEFLCMKATELLLFADEVAEIEIAELEQLGKALLVKRFDRNSNGQKLHFEEFAQLLNIEASDKYYGSYKDMADYMKQSRFCTRADMEKLLRRILACILLGNTDAHFKNFAMFHQADDLSFTPIYDMVFVKYYQDMADEMALDLIPKQKLRVQDLKPKHLRLLAEDFGFDERVLINIRNDFEKRLDLIYDFIREQKQLDSGLRSKFEEYIKKRWQGLFKNIGAN